MAKSNMTGQKLRDAIRATSIEGKPNHAKIKLLAQYGTLAPSTHNTQPWQLEIADSQLKVYIDFSKSVPVADPTTRDMYISLGALTRNVELAAHEFGIKTKTKFARPLHESELVATVTFENLEEAKDPKKSEVLQGILKRQNYRGFFKEQFEKTSFDKIVKEVLAAQQGVQAKTVTTKSTIEKLAELTAKGLRMGYAMPTFRKEIGGLINHNLSRKKHGLHGYSLRLTTPQSFVIPQIMKRKDIGKKLAGLNYKSFILSPVVMVLATDKDTEEDWLATGQVMEELMVRLATAGMATSIYTASVEMKGLREELMDILSIEKKPLPQVLFCVGAPGAPLPYSVRKSFTRVTR